MTVEALVAPRLGQVDEQQVSRRRALFWEGHALGFHIAWASGPAAAALRDKYAEARGQAWASPMHSPEQVEQVRGYMLRADRGRDWGAVFWACGVLEGYKQATAERPDAAECAVCDLRVLTAVDEFQECAFHGIKCSDHLNELCDEGCWRHGNVSGVA